MAITPEYHSEISRKENPDRHCGAAYQRLCGLYGSVQYIIAQSTSNYIGKLKILMIHLPTHLHAGQSISKIVITNPWQRKFALSLI